MSDIAENALRYTNGNTARSDYPSPHNGEIVHSDGNGATVGFDCSGFVCHVIIESGYRIDYETTTGLLGSQAFITILEDQIQPGDILLFPGHVGVVIKYNPSSKIGRFMHMSGNREKGGRLKMSPFVVGLKNVVIESDDGRKSIYYGNSLSVSAVRRIKSNRYSAELDLHRNGSNPLPTLRPLGVRVYSNYLRHKDKPPQTHLAKHLKKKPTQKPLKLKSTPPKDPLVVAVQRVGTFVTGYRRKWEHLHGDLRTQVRFPFARH